MKRLTLSLSLLASCAVTGIAQDMAAENVRQSMHEKLKLKVVSARFTSDTPDWVVTEPARASPLKWIKLTHEPVPNGVRYRRMQQEKQVREASHPMWRILWQVREKAQKDGGVSVASVDELDWSTRVSFFESPYESGKPSAERMAADAEAQVQSLRESGENQKQYRARRIESMQMDAALMAKQLTEIDAKLKGLDPANATDEQKQLMATRARLEKRVAESSAQIAAMRKGASAEDAAEDAAHADAIVRAQKQAAEMKAKLEAGRNTVDKNKVAYFYLIPKVVIDGEEVPMLLELRPFVDDGKHYVGFSNGAVRRVPVDKELLKQCGVTIHPLHPLPTDGKDVMVPYTVYAQVVDATAKNARVALVNRKDPKKAMTVTIDLQKATVAEESVDFGTWASLRAMDWVHHARLLPDAPCYYWLWRLNELYGAEKLDNLDEMMAGTERDDSRRGRQVSIFSLLGGRAAIQETLQTQVIGVDIEDQGAQTAPVADIKGVAVKSHDYATMLGDAPGGQLSIAELVPHDRLMVYFRRPADLADFLDTGEGFMYESGSTASASSFDHGLKDRYAEILGVGTGWGKIFLKSKVVKQIVAFAPDVFFTDGTDLTVVMEIESMDLLAPLLGIFGVNGLGDGKVVTKSGASGSASYWCATGNYLMISSNLKEMAQARKLLNANGEGSLGKSDEFRYMLTKLPMSASTWAFAYASDPFIRRLVGPEVKIGQYRRIKAQAEMEALSAAALLYRVDSHTEKPTIQRLVELGYAKPSLAARDYVLHDDLSVSSKTYGRPSRLNSIQALNVRNATEAEKQAYVSYMEDYNQFWRQFFDPIAVRLDERPEGELEMEIFILPLIDSSIYRSVREVVGRPGTGPRMKIPQLNPSPVAMVSAKLQETVWMEALGKFGTEAFEGFGIQNFPFDELGPSVHLAIMDGDPVVALGSGDLLGAFNGNSRLFGRNSQMFLIPAVLSVLTRPCKVLVELRDEDKVKQSLRAALAATLRINWEMTVSFSQIKGKDAWIVTFDIAGMVKLRFGLKVQNNYLVISNLPWNDADVSQVALADSLDSAAIQVIPSAGVQQLPGLFSANNSSQRNAAMKSAARLWPMMAAGASDLTQARSWHQTMYGFTPGHPGRGEFQWANGSVVSDRFGSWDHQLEPEYVKGNADFGLLGKIKFLNLSMQLEDDGLRTRLRWKWSK